MKFQRYRDWLIVILALAVPFWFLRASMKDPKTITGPDRVMMQIAAPIQNAAAMLARGVSHLWGDYVYLVDVKKENGGLASQNARLRDRVRDLEGMEAENRRLKRLLDLKTSLPSDTVSAGVIGKNTNEFFRVIRVTLDSASPGISDNLPVISPDGVVGTTLKVAGDTIDVRLVVDAGAGVDAIVDRTGARGYVKGTGNEREYACSIEYVQRTDEVDVGDILVTSGKGQRFPKGIPVCKVTAVTKRDFGIYQQVLCVPTVDFSRLEEVLVVLSPEGAAHPPPPGPTPKPKDPPKPKATATPTAEGND